MFASFRTSRYSLSSRYPFSWRIRYGFGGLGAALVAFASVTHVASAPVCKPELVVGNVNFSPMDIETMRRRWSAVLSVDATRCATRSGRFQIRFEQLKETAPDTDFAESFTWRPGVIEVSIDFAADESVAAYRIEQIASCPCRQ